MNGTAMSISGYPQRSEEWFEARLGKVTASHIYDATAKNARGGYYKAREDYMNLLICERFTGQAQDTFVTQAVQRGVAFEPVARDFYAARTGNRVIETGFVPHPFIEESGASPDGLVGDNGLVEIKCPNTQTHIAFFRSGVPKEEYILQMQWQMACTGRAWCDFVSYDDRLPLGLSYKCVRIDRDEKTIKMLEDEVRIFLDELNTIFNDLKMYQDKGSPDIWDEPDTQTDLGIEF